MILFLFFFALGFVFQNPLEHHIHILREGTVALFGKRFDSFDNVMIKRKTYIPLQINNPHFNPLLTFDYIAKYCETLFCAL